MKDGLIESLEKKKKKGVCLARFIREEKIIKNTNESEAQFVLS